MAVTGRGLDAPVRVPVMFWTSARQGGTDTTAKLFGADAKWLVPGFGILRMKASQVRLRLVVWRAWFGR